MSDRYLVVAEQIDALLVRRLAAPERANPDAVIDAGGRSSAVSLARTLLVTRPAQVALLVDADSTNNRAVAEIQQELESSLAAVAETSRARVFLAVPAIEGWLFEDSQGVLSYFGDVYSPELAIRAEYAPREVLVQLFHAKGMPCDARSVAELLDHLDQNRLRGIRVVAELLQFLAPPKAVN